ncbi:MAG: nucleotidyl transferase AbiEii/AbiGii toxin family protein [Prevotella sp.]|nr:nucleotidyl transferase AbiEii/AbiGii toxin family protein [Prevotella sp.]MBR3479535.1 nucleotidyl transferase AbiEii/AbiGii toxin family protein [Prevotella sp.]
MSLYDEMVAERAERVGTATPNVEQEVMQRIALAGLHRGGFFQHAAFYGGTCLRIFHNLPRFSEDMDFSLVEKRVDVHLEDYFPSIIEEFKLAGHEVNIVKKEKKIFGRVESAFLKENTEAYDIKAVIKREQSQTRLDSAEREQARTKSKFQTKKTVKVKIELDIDPPLAFETEQKMLVRPYTFMARCFTLPYLYAGKMHALVYRAWQRRIKGRDWYDFEWYVRHQIPLDYQHLQERIREFSGEMVEKEEFMRLLREKLSTSDIELVKQDVTGFIDDPRELDIWSNDYFLQLADMIVFK